MDITDPTGKHTHTIINLHGRGSTATEYRAEFEESETSDGRTLRDIFPGVKWVYPTAPKVRSQRFDQEMSQWFDMWRTEDPSERSRDQMQDLEASAATIRQLVLEEVKEVGLENVVLCGISQGAATALTAMMGMEVRLGGFIGFSTWLTPLTKAMRPQATIRMTPVLLEHCGDDDVIDVRFGKELSKHLKGLGMEVRWESYDEGGHWINEPKGVDNMVEFLKKIVG